MTNPGRIEYYTLAQVAELPPAMVEWNCIKRSFKQFINRIFGRRLRNEQPAYV